jgi:apolipoprotein N-acyltransferase
VPAHSRGSVLLGADALLNITNDSWFGQSTEPWFHMLLTAFRSIELRRPLIRGTNTGFSALIDITGEQRYKTRLFEPATIDATLRFPGPGQKAPETFYLRHGELFAGFCQVVACLVLAWIFWPAIRAWPRERFKRKTGA